MANNRKKTNDRYLQKISKAKHRNDFIANLKSFCDKITLQNTAQLIPSNEWDNIYTLRCHPVKIIDMPGVSSDVLKDFKWIIPQMFKTRFIDFGIGAYDKISLYDYFTSAFTLLLYSIRIKDSDYKNAALVRGALSPLAALADGEIYNNAWKQYFEIINSMSFLNSDLSDCVYILKHETKTEINGKMGFWYCIEIHPIKPEITKVLIDDGKRPVYRIGIGVSDPTPHLEYITIQREALGLPMGEPLQVYIQSHAINRLNERVSGILNGILQFNLYHSLKQLKVSKNKKGEYLFEYYIFGKKVGYLCGVIIDDKIIIRTFLFLTNNGTPEGIKLHNNTGLMKEDKMYLSIDKLSSFINSDITKNEAVKNVFMQAGCESLFEIDTDIIFSVDALKEKSNANLIAEYLQRRTDF